MVYLEKVIDGVVETTEVVPLPLDVIITQYKKDGYEDSGATVGGGISLSMTVHGSRFSISLWVVW